ncbi:MAG: DUF3822 family protein [Chlorobi bacterium]|nr:DUF3822 family protein [Chlorobiota bacterium]
MPPYRDKHIGFYDKSFQETKTEDYILSILIGSQDFVFTLYHPEKRTFIGFEKYPFGELKNARSIDSGLSELLKKRYWLDSSFYQINVIYDNDLNTLIPLSLFIEKERSVYLRFNHPGQKDNSAEYDLLKNLEMANVYYMPVQAINKAVELWPETRFYHYSSVLLQSLAINYKNKTEDNKLFVNLREGVFDVVNFKTGKLNFYNAFRYKSDEDFIYFLLATIEQLKLNPEDVGVILSGNIEKGDPKYEMVYRYIRHFEYIERNETFRYSYVMEELGFPKYYVLFNVIQCE